MVVGDIMLDQYVTCDVIGQSPEDDVALKLRPVKRVYKGGGALNVALNLDKLGAQVDLIGRTGRDAARDILLNLVHNNTLIELHEAVSENCPTTQKTRYMTSKQHRHVCRVDDECVSDEKDSEIVTLFKRHIKETHDLIIISDYGKGVVSNNLIRQLGAQAVPYIVDPKRKDLKDYGPAVAITPNEAEGLDDRNQTKSFFSDWLIVTQSERGASAFRQHPDFGSTGRPQFMFSKPTRLREVGDPAGCGDSFVATFALAVAQGATPEQAVSLGCAAGAVAYDHVGVHNVSMDELLSELETFDYEAGVQGGGQ